MDELVIDIFGRSRNNKVRLYDLRAGFHGGVHQVSMPAAACFFMMPIAVRHYEFSGSGDITVEETREMGFRNISVRWTDEAQSRGAGTGELTMTNPDLPDMPVRFQLTMGDREQIVMGDGSKCEHCAELPAAPPTAVQQMVSHMLAHMHFGS